MPVPISLPDTLKNSDLSLHTFKRHLKTFRFSSYWHIQRVWGFYKNALYKFTVIIIIIIIYYIIITIIIIIIKSVTDSKTKT